MYRSGSVSAKLINTNYRLAIQFLCGFTPIETQTKQRTRRCCTIRRANRILYCVTVITDTSVRTQWLNRKCRCSLFQYIHKCRNQSVWFSTYHFFVLFCFCTLINIQYGAFRMFTVMFNFFHNLSSQVCLYEISIFIYMNFCRLLHAYLTMNVNIQSKLYK